MILIEKILFAHIETRQCYLFVIRAIIWYGNSLEFNLKLFRNPRMSHSTTKPQKRLFMCSQWRRNLAWTFYPVLSTLRIAKDWNLLQADSVDWSDSLRGRCPRLSTQIILLVLSCWSSNGLRQVNLVLIAYASSEGSGEPAHPRSLARTIAARSYKQWVKRNLQTESQIPGPSEWLGMRS